MLSDYDIDLIRRDTALPGLSILLDAEAFVTALGPFVSLVRPASAQATYVRYKPGMNCLVAYELTMGQESLMVYAKAHRPVDVQKMQKAGDREIVNTTIGPGRVVIEDAAIMVSFFPNDSKLRILTRLADESSSKRLLKRVFYDRSEYWPGEIESLRYKPERRFVARYCVHDLPKAVLKFYTESDYRRAINHTRAFKAAGPLRLAARVGRSNRHGILAMEWVSGDPMSEMLGQDALDESGLMVAGAGLAALHTSNTKKLAHIPVERQAASLKAMAEDLRLIWPALELKAEDLAMRLSQELVQAVQAKICPLHGDFYANQVLISDDKAAIIDLDESFLGDPASDVGNFLAHIERDRLCGRLSANRIERIRPAFLDGYDSVAPRPSSGQIDLYTAVSLFRLALHPFRYREPDWPHRMESILTRAETLLHNASGTGPFFVQHSQKTLQSSTADSGVSVSVHAEVSDDVKMPFLSQALQPDEAWLKCRPFFQAIAGATSDLTLCDIRLLRHKPGRRCLIEYSATFGRSGGESRCFSILGKSRAKGLDKSTYALMQTLWEGAFNEQSDDGIFVPEPLGLVPSFNMWLQQKVNGSVATPLLDQSRGYQISRDIAQALWKLQESGPPVERKHTIKDELAILARRLPLLSQGHPTWDERIEKVLKDCRHLADRLPETSLRPVHRDFYPDNILVTDRGVCLLDFDLYCMGDPALDAGNFIGHLIEYGLRKHRDPDHLKASAQSFEDTFVSLAGEPVRSHVHIYSTLTLARHVHISSLIPERRHITENLLHLCEERLARQLADRTSVSLNFK